jgi:2,3-bisphosphoglycerate-independent phosphoglycerate mutase
MDTHEVNKKRAAQGKLKANVILTRDAGHLLPRFPNINKKYHLRFASLTDMPVERGISKLAGMHTIRLPPPTSDTKKDCTLRLNKLLNALPNYDCFYTHIKGPDEPGHDGNYTLKTRLIASIDEHFFGKLLPKIDLKTHIICVTADHATPCELRTHSDDPVPLLISGNRIKGDSVSKFSEKACERGSLDVLEKGTDLMSMLVGFVKK